MIEHEKESFQILKNPGNHQQMAKYSQWPFCEPERILQEPLENPHSQRSTFRKDLESYAILKES